MTGRNKWPPPGAKEVKSGPAPGDTIHPDALRYVQERGADPMTDRPKERVARELYIQQQLVIPWADNRARVNAGKWWDNGDANPEHVKEAYSCADRILEALRSGGEEPSLEEQAISVWSDLWEMERRKERERINDPRSRIIEHWIRMTAIYGRANCFPGTIPVTEKIIEELDTPSTETDAPTEGEGGCPECGGQAFVSDRYGVWCGNENCRAPVGHLCPDPDEGSEGPYHCLTPGCDWTWYTADIVTCPQCGADQDEGSGEGEEHRWAPGGIEGKDDSHCIFCGHSKSESDLSGVCRFRPEPEGGDERPDTPQQWQTAVVLQHLKDIAGSTEIDLTMDQVTAVGVAIDRLSRPEPTVEGERVDLVALVRGDIGRIVARLHDALGDLGDTLDGAVRVEQKLREEQSDGNDFRAKGQVVPGRSRDRASRPVAADIESLRVDPVDDHEPTSGGDRDG